MDIKIGDSTKYTIKINPDTSGAKDFIITDHMKTSRESPLSCSLKFTWETNLVKSLKAAAVNWLFYNTKAPNQLAGTETMDCNFKKNGDTFECTQIDIPTTDFFNNNIKTIDPVTKNIKTCLGLKFNTKASLPIIKNDFVTKEQKDIDFSYNIEGTIQTISGEKKFKSINELLRIKDAYLGSAIKIKHTKGDYIPRSFSAHLFIFEDDSASLADLTGKTYEFKINSKTKLSEIRRNKNNVFESIKYDEIELSTDESTMYLGITKDKLIYCGDKEGVDGKKQLEFIFLLNYYIKDLNFSGFNKLNQTEVYYEPFPKNYYLIIKKPTVKFSLRNVEKQNYLFVIIIENINPDMVDYNRFAVSAGTMKDEKFVQNSLYSTSKPAELSKEKAKITVTYKVQLGSEKNSGVRVNLENIFLRALNDYNPDFVNSVFEFEKTNKIISLNNDGKKSASNDHKIVFFEMQ